MKAADLPAALWQVIDASNRLRLHDPALAAARTTGVLRWGPSLSAAVHAAALRWPLRTAIIDDAGAIDYLRLDRAADALARDLRRGKGPVGLLCRNHRGFVIGQLATERATRPIVLLNTALPAGQLADIIVREAITTIVSDDEFIEPVEAALVAGDTPAASEGTVAFVSAEPDDLPQWRFPGLLVGRWCRNDTVLLTSGTTGPPKGARQGRPKASLAAVGVLDAIPLRHGDTTLVASPLFHAWGYTQSAMALATGSTLILHRRFDPAAVLASLEDHDVTVLAAVPLMVRRILEATPDHLRLPRLRATLCSGNVLSADLALAWIERFGANLYNLYGSTETAIATVADPFDLLAAPGTVGRPPRGVTIAILDPDGHPVAPGEAGRVFTANGMQFAGYTDGSDKPRRDDLMATGDHGWFDAQGRLFIDGREGDMIVSGGENVFPSRIEEVLVRHPAVAEAGVVGVTGDDYGQRIAAYVVATPGTALDADELDAWAREHLGPFERPRELHLVDELPRTATGKIRRGLLPNGRTSATISSTTEAG